MTIPHLPTPATWLANRVLDHCVQLGVAPVSQLKLQKLCFYAAGIAWAHGHGAEFSSLVFEAWKHGPVLREVYRPGGALPLRESVPSFSPWTEFHIADAIAVYGHISPWGLREQTHLEAPYIAAFRQDRPGCPATISAGDVSAHFATKFLCGARPPEHLVDRGIFVVDGLQWAPVFPSFHALADHVRCGLKLAPRA